MVTELVDNAIDEAQAGYCDRVSVTVHADDSVTVEDNGRGIPVGEHPVHERETLEIILTDLHSGGKFDDNAYKVSGGLHGVGLSVVNALAESLLVEVKREGKVWQQRYARGFPVHPIREVGRTREDRDEDHLPGGPRDLQRHVLQLRRPLAAAPRARLPEPRRHDRRRRRARREGAEAAHLPVRGGDPLLRRAPEQEQGAAPRGRHHLLGRQGRDGRPRGRREERAARRGPPVERRLRGADLLLHEHDLEQGRRDAPRGAEGGADAGDPAVRRGGTADEEPQGDDALRRRLPRGAHRRRLAQDPRPEVLLADEGEARLAGGEDLGPDRDLREALELLRGEPEGRPADRREDRRGGAGPRGGAQGARARPAQGRPRRGGPPRQARRLPGRGSGSLGALHRRGGLGRRLGQAGARPAEPRRSSRSRERS